MMKVSALILELILNSPEKCQEKTVSGYYATLLRFWEEGINRYEEQFDQDRKSEIFCPDFKSNLRIILARDDSFIDTFLAYIKCLF